MRLTQEEMKAVTGLQQPSAQVRWFKAHFGIVVACDRAGPILTQSAFEALVAKRYGLRQDAAAPEARPSVRLREAHA